MKLYASKHNNLNQQPAMQVADHTIANDIPEGVCVVYDANDWKACRDLPNDVTPAHKGDWIVMDKGAVRVVSNRYFRQNWYWDRPAAMKM